MSMLHSLFKVWFDASDYPLSSPDLVAFRQPYAGDPLALYLTGLTGWYEENSLTLLTQVKLLGEGSYVTGVRNDNKNVRLDLVGSYDDEFSLRESVDEIRAHILGQTSTLTPSILELQFFTSSSFSPLEMVRTETLEAYLTSLTELKEYEDGEALTYSVGFTATEPVIEVTLGS